MTSVSDENTALGSDAEAGVTLLSAAPLERNYAGKAGKALAAVLLMAGAVVGTYSMLAAPASPAASKSLALTTLSGSGTSQVDFDVSDHLPLQKDDKKQEKGDSGVGIVVVDEYFLKKKLAYQLKEKYMPGWHDYKKTIDSMGLMPDEVRHYLEKRADMETHTFGDRGGSIWVTMQHGDEQPGGTCDRFGTSVAYKLTKGQVAGYKAAEKAHTGCWSLADREKWLQKTSHCWQIILGRDDTPGHGHTDGHVAGGNAGENVNQAFEMDQWDKQHHRTWNRIQETVNAAAAVHGKVSIDMIRGDRTDSRFVNAATDHAHSKIYSPLPTSARGTPGWQQACLASFTKSGGEMKLHFTLKDTKEDKGWRMDTMHGGFYAPHNVQDQTWRISDGKVPDFDKWIKKMAAGSAWVNPEVWVNVRVLHDPE